MPNKMGRLHIAMLAKVVSKPAIDLFISTIDLSISDMSGDWGSFLRLIRKCWDAGTEVLPAWGMEERFVVQKWVSEEAAEPEMPYSIRVCVNAVVLAGHTSMAVLRRPDETPC